MSRSSLAAGVELGREPLERRERALGARPRAPRAPSPSSGASASTRGRDAPRASSATWRDALALGAQLVLDAAARSPPCPRRAPPARRAAPRAAPASRVELVVAAARGRERPPGARAPPRRRSSCSAPTNASSTSSWYDGPRQAPLLELARHRDRAARSRRRGPRGRRRGPRRTPACGRRANTRRASTSPGSSSGRSSASAASSSSSKKPSGDVELGLDVRLVAARRRRRRRRPCAPSSSPIAWVEDRLAGAGLARERGEARAERRGRPRSISTRFSMRRRRSTVGCVEPARTPDDVPAGHARRQHERPRPARAQVAKLVAVPPHERRLGQRREQRAPLAEPDRDARPPGPASPTRWPSTSTAQATSAVPVPHVDVACRAGRRAAGRGASAARRT